MVSLKDRAGNGESGFWGSDFLPVVADVVGWVGLFLCVVGFLFLLGEGLATMFEGYAPMELP
jgi:hypothetical protein